MDREQEKTVIKSYYEMTPSVRLLEDLLDEMTKRYHQQKGGLRSEGKNFAVTCKELQKAVHRHESK